MISCLDGAKKLVGAFELNTQGKLIILSDKNNADFLDYVLQAAKELGIADVTSVVIPEIFRPLTKIPSTLESAIENSDALLQIVSRIPEENFNFNRPILNLCKEVGSRYLYIYDPKIQYLREGIAADYKIVEKKARKVKEILENSKRIAVTSDLGTNLTFAIYNDDVRPRSPLFTQGVPWIQAPEGEVMSCPLEETFNGVMVIDGPITGLGQPEEHVLWTFKNGFVSNVEGPSKLLDQLLSLLQRSDPNLSSLIGLDIAEFSVGVNDWAVYDDNISNCEKVSGGIHFGFGHVKGSMGKYMGGTFHFDNIMKFPKITIEMMNGEFLVLTEKGSLNI